MWQASTNPANGHRPVPDRSSARVMEHQQDLVRVAESSPAPSTNAFLSPSSPSPSSNKYRNFGAENDVVIAPDDDTDLTFTEKISNSLGSYITIEAIWQVALFGACYRYRPLVRLSRSERAHHVLHKVQTTLFGTNNNNSRGLVPSVGKTKGGGAGDGLSSDAVSGSFTKRLQSLGICSSSIVRRLPGGSRTLLAASEWFFFNKVIGIPLWPTKVLLAGWVTKKLEEHHIIQKRRTIRRNSTTTPSTSTSSKTSVQCQQ